MQNAQRVEAHFLFLTVTISQAGLSIVSLLAGFVLGVVLGASLAGKPPTLGKPSQP
ncbi:MAG: hypothetical protein L0Z62_21540 [Gemmataceae bacterium]|nr:hypothetical protein [Gemmataceae bacterium]